jgi:hypothetical protein
MDGDMLAVLLTGLALMVTIALTQIFYRKKNLDLADELQALSLRGVP